jgi:sulfide:quinone oxidoreductase
LEGDAIIVALGAQLAPQSIPGLSEYGLNIYAVDSLGTVKDALASFGGGRIVVGIFGLPYKCSAAPYEIALLINENMKARGVAAEVEVFTPQPMSLPVLGDAGCGVIEGRLSGHSIGFYPLHKAVSVTERQIQFANGKERSFDLLLAIAPHQCPDVVVESGLTGGGEWLKVNPQTMQTSFEGVFAVGDIVAIPMANGKRLPMAGIFAESEGQVAAQQIAAEFENLESETSFSGFGGCYLEVGGGQAMMVEGNFLAQPAPQVELSGPSSDYYQKKIAFERERLQRWLG